MRRTFCVVVTSGIALAALAAAPAAPAAPTTSIVGSRIYIAFDDPADVAKVTEFTIDFGAPQTCRFENGFYYADDAYGMSNMHIEEDDEGGYGYFWSYGVAPYVAAMGITTETITRTSEDGAGSLSAHSDGEVSGRRVVTLLATEPAEPYVPEHLPAAMALDLTCERPVTLTARASDTLTFLPNRTAPVSAQVPLAARIDVLGEWDMTIDEPEGHLRAGISGAAGDQVGDVHLATPDETVDIVLPHDELLHLTAGPGTYRAEITQLQASGYLWVATYGFAGPMDLTPFLRDAPVFPPWSLGGEEPS